VRLFRLNIATGRQSEVGQSPQMRGLAFSPDRRYLVYYVSFQPDTVKNGLWLLDLQQTDPQPQKRPFFGSYRWRDTQRLLYIPFDPAAAGHNFYEYNVLTGQSRPLFPGGTGLTVANNDWRVSPDGRSLALVADKAGALDGIWLLSLPPLPD
jgi:Tol biopolymer transport system component